MANFICELNGVRGRNLKVYDTKIVITTKISVGSVLTGNSTDGTKTIYLCDVVGVQFKKSGNMIGFIQFETSSLQMDNKSDNFSSENTFTYEKGKNGITNGLMEYVYNFICDRIEEIKYNVSIIDIDTAKNKIASLSANNQVLVDMPVIERAKASVNKAEFLNTPCCPACKEDLSFMGWEAGDLAEAEICPFCDVEILFE